VKTLSRRTTEAVTVDCKPGSPTILTFEEKDYLAKYCVTLSDMEFRSCRNVMRRAYLLTEKSRRYHSFKNTAARRAWYDGFAAGIQNLPTKT